MHPKSRDSPCFWLLLGIIRNSALCLLFRDQNKRHAYATHQLEAGLPVHQLQHLLGHQDIRTTLHYIHWVPGYRPGETGTDLIAALEVSHGGH